MQTNNLTQKNYTTLGSIYQLKLPLNIECIIPKDDSVRLLGQIVEEMNLQEIYQSYSRARNNQATPKTDAQDSFVCLYERLLFFKKY